MATLILILQLKDPLYMSLIGIELTCIAESTVAGETCSTVVSFVEGESGSSLEDLSASAVQVIFPSCGLFCQCMFVY